MSTANIVNYINMHMEYECSVHGSKETKLRPFSIMFNNVHTHACHTDANEIKPGNNGDENC